MHVHLVEFMLNGCQVRIYLYKLILESHVILYVLRLFVNEI
jgi:hypothetical protein